MTGSARQRRRTGWGPTADRLRARDGARDRVAVPEPPRALRTPAEAPREEVRRFEWPCPGDLLQMDTKRFARFSQARARRHRRPLRTAQREAHTGRLGVLPLDHRRPHPPGLHRDPPRRASPDRHRLRRARARVLRRPRHHPKRLQTDNAWCYMHNRSLRELLARHDIQHRRIPPRTPKRNGKSSATSRPSPASGPTGSATATQRQSQQRYRSGSTTTTPPGTTARSPTGHPSPAFGTNRGTTPSRGHPAQPRLARWAPLHAGAGELPQM